MLTAVNAAHGDLYKETRRKKVMALFTANYSDSDDELEAAHRRRSKHRLPHEAIAESRRRRLDGERLRPEEASRIPLTLWI